MENLRAAELRIGNYVQLNTNITQVDVIDYNQIIATEFGLIELKYIKPIALTEEWLIKFGYIKVREYFSINDDWLSVHFENQNYYIYINSDKVILQSVHQLQNLYFALTGEELKQK